MRKHLLFAIILALLLATACLQLPGTDIQETKTRPTNNAPAAQNAEALDLPDFTSHLADNETAVPILAEFTTELADNPEITIETWGMKRITQQSNSKHFEFDLPNQIIRHVKLDGVRRNSRNTILIDKDMIAHTQQSYAIDTSTLDFTNGTIQVTAKGNSLYKCPTWNFTTRTCEQTCTTVDNETTCDDPWRRVADLVPGQEYTIDIGPNDPAFYETSESADVAIMPVNETTFVAAFVDRNQSRIALRILNTSGGIILNTTVVDSTADNQSRVAMRRINTTHFTISWVDGPSDALRTQIFLNNGSNTTNAITIDPAIGQNTDVGLAALGTQYVTCYANDNNGDAMFNRTTNNGTTTTAGISADTSITPSLALQNLVDCAAASSNSFAITWYDDQSNDASYALYNSSDGTATGEVDLDADVGELAQVSVASTSDRYFFVFYDNTDQDITISIVNTTNSAILAVTDIDTSAGATSSVAATTAFRNQTSTEEVFIAAWQDTNSNDIKAAVYNSTGGQITAPFVVTTASNTTNQIISIASKSSISNISICPGRFIVAYSNTSNQSEFKTFLVNGSSWNGFCPDIRAPLVQNITPIAGTGFNSSANVSISANITDDLAVTAALINVTAPNGTIYPLALTYNSTSQLYETLFTNTTTLGSYNITFFANDSTGNANTTGKTNFTITDAGTPLVDSPANQNVDLGSESNIVWTITDNTDQNGTYNVTKGITSFIPTSTWYNNTPITVPLDTSVLDLSIYSISFKDNGGTDGTPDFVVINVSDLNAPSCNNFTSQSTATLRNITINGDFTDWQNVLSNPYNYQVDQLSGAGDPDVVPAAEHDLTQVAFTYNTSTLFFYFQRAQTSSHTTTALLYVDYNRDGYMNSTDKVLRYQWTKTGTYTFDYLNYIPANASGDPMLGNGDTLPGSITANATIATAILGGNVPPTTLEVRTNWTNIGLAGPTALRIQPAMAQLTGTTLPAQVQDNVDLIDTSSIQLLLRQSQGRSALNGTTVVYPVEVGNCGNTNDRINLANISSQNYTLGYYFANGTLLTDTNADGLPDITLASPSATTITTRITIPANATAGTTDITTITATQSNGTDQINLTTSIGNIVITPLQQILSGARTSYAQTNFTVTNNQNFADVFDITATSNNSYTLTLRFANGTLLTDTDSDTRIDVGTLQPKTSTNITVRIDIPAGAAIGTVDLTSIRANSSVAPTLSANASAVTTVRNRITILSDQNGSAGIGGSVFYPLSIINAGNQSDVVDLTNTSVLNFPTAFYASDLATILIDTDSDGINDTGNISPFGGSKMIYVGIAVPLTAQQNQIENTTIIGNSSINTTANSTVILRTNVQSVTTFSNPTRTTQQVPFEVNAPVYARAFALNGVTTVFYQWTDPNLTILRTSPAITVTPTNIADDDFSTNNTLDLGNYSVSVFNSKKSTLIGTTIFNLRDTTKPNVTLISPAPASNYNISNSVDLRANITDNYRLNFTSVTVTYPNGTQTTFNLTNTSNTFNATFVVPNLQGQYNVTYFANDTSNNTNNTITTTFFGRGPPSIIAIGLNGNTYLFNDTARIQANITDFEPISAGYVNLTYPNSTTTTFNLTANGSIYEFNLSNLILRGRYNVTFFANDTFNYENATITGFFIRRALDVVDIINLSNSAYLTYNTTVLANQSGTLNLSIAIQGKHVTTLNITSHNENSPYSVLRIDDQNPYIASSLTAEYVIDPSGMNFSSATANITATGSTLFVCKVYNSSAGECIGGYAFNKTITPGQPYSITLTPNDPAFSESSAAADVALAPVNDTAFILAYVNTTGSSIQYQYLRTTGTLVENSTTVQSSVNNASRVDIVRTNQSNFTVSWIDNTLAQGRFKNFRVNTSNTSNTTNTTTFDSGLGTNTDIGLAGAYTRFNHCYIDDSTADALYEVRFNNGTQVAAAQSLDNNVAPTLTLQNLIDCAGINETRIVHFWFDDQQDDVTVELTDEAGNSLTAPTDIDTNVGETGQVAVTNLNNNSFGVLFYDSTDEDITYSIRSANNLELVAPTDIDTNAGTVSRVAAGIVRNNRTSTQDLFVAAYWNSNTSTIRAAVITANGTNITAPFTVDTAPNTTFPIIDIMGVDSIYNITICPSTFVVAYTNSSGAGVFKQFFYNGTSWDGFCGPDLVPNNISFNNTNPAEFENITINATILNNNTENATPFRVNITDGFCNNGTNIANFTINFLPDKRNTTISTSWIAPSVGPHNISVCADSGFALVEPNETNNNLTYVINVKAYQDYYGSLSGNVTLDTVLNNTFYDWNFTDNGNVYFIDSDQTINFTRLLPIGKNTTLGDTTNDFSDADTALAMAGFNDSIQVLWALNASTPRYTATFIVRGRTINTVPIINSTNTSAFITGILWDPTNDTNGQYDTTEREPLVFIGNINHTAAGFYGTYDYEVHVPVLLRNYSNTTSQLGYFIELR